MEGTSLYEVWKQTHIEWVLVKAICDWADADKNDAHQMLAAKNAASFVIQVVRQEQFVHKRVVVKKRMMRKLVSFFSGIPLMRMIIPKRATTHER